MKLKTFLFLVFLPIMAYSQQGTKNFIDQNYIEVWGKSVMEVVPDQIYIDILIRETDNKGKETVEELEKIMIGELIDMGIDVDSVLSVKDFTSNFKFYFLKKTDIRTSKQYQLIVKDAGMAAKVFDALEKDGISNLNIARVDHSNIVQYRREVKVEAVKAAKEKASAMLEGIGQHIGRAIYIQEMNNNIYGMRKNEAANSIMIKGLSTVADDEVIPEIEFEKIRLDYSVMVRFEIQ